MYEWERQIQVMVDEIDECLNSHSDGEPTLRGLARKLGYSEFHATRKFREITGMSFRDYLKELDAHKPVIVTGDMNVAHEEIDLKNPKTNKKNAGFTQEERDKFSELLDAGFVDSFRYFYPDKTGAYSWWSYRFKAREKNAGWRIDYFCVSDRLQDKLTEAEIHTEVYGSDHCPVEVRLDL